MKQKDATERIGDTMKPNTTLARMLQSLTPGDTATLHACATLLAQGEVAPVLDSARLAHAIDPDAWQEWRDVAASVRVAVAYGDLTGLQGVGYPLAPGLRAR